MKFLLAAILALSLLATPALAQQPTPSMQAMSALLHQAVDREANVTVKATEAIAQLQSQLEAVTKERDTLKVAVMQHPTPEPEK